MGKLVGISGSVLNKEFLLDKFMIIGRASLSDIPLIEKKASRTHARTEMAHGNVFIEDLNSTNGTYLNDKKITKKAKLSFGDIIRVGECKLRFESDNQELIPVIEGYDIIKRVGLGGMGMVFKARQLSMDRIVAIKVLNERFSSDPKFIDRFISEARAAGRLNHPNIIRAHDVSHFGEVHYFCMEFVDGIDVRGVLKEWGQVPIPFAVDIMLQAAEALQYAHNERLVHRDVKPDNLMVTSKGIIKLADLGIAKSFDRNDEGNAESSIVGTPHYMAPEQVLKKPVDHRADIYALGATMYHVISGRTPFAGGDMRELLRAHVNKPAPSLREHTPSVPAALDKLIVSMMSKDPDERPIDMNVVCKILERIKIKPKRVTQEVRETIKNGTPLEDVLESKVKKIGTASRFDSRQTFIEQPSKVAIGICIAAAACIVLAIVFMLLKPAPSEIPVTVISKTEPTIEKTPSAILWEKIKVAPKAEVKQLCEQLRLEFPASIEADKAYNKLAATTWHTAQELEKENTASAIVKYTELINLYPNTEEEKWAHSALSRIHQATQKEFEARVVELRNNEVSMSIDSKIRMSAWVKLKEEYNTRANTAAADEKIKYYQNKIETLKNDTSRKKQEALNREINLLLKHKKYRDAIIWINSHTTEINNSDVASLTLRIEEGSMTQYNDLQKQIANKNAASKIIALQNYTENFATQNTTGVARSELTKLQEDIRNINTNALSSIRELVKKYNHPQALRVVSRTMLELNQTEYKNKWTVYQSDIKTLKSLHDDVILANRKTKSKKLKTPIITSLGEMTHITQAQKNRITLAIKNGPSSSYEWAELSPKNIVMIYRSILPSISPQQKAALIIFEEWHGD